VRRAQANRARGTGWRIVGVCPFAHFAAELQVNQETCKNSYMARYRQRIISDAGDGWQIVEQQPIEEARQPAAHTLDIRPPEPGESYADFISSHGVRYFSVQEVTLFRRESRHVEPPRAMWSNIIPALRICDELRETLGHPLSVGSAYRDVAYNLKVRGAPSSQHLHNRAIDVDLPADCRGNEERKRFADEAAKLWNAHADALRMGIGFYQHLPSRVHIDTGYRARFWERQFAWPILQRNQSQ
jgi:uncharacterized protein YcbK (DUF882 family)